MLYQRSILSVSIAVALLFSSQAQASDGTEESTEEAVEEIIVLGVRKASYTEITEDAVKLVEMPGSLGDPLGAISALPGVITPSGGGEPAVRGSSPSDNRYYIDSIPAGYIFHQFNTSIFDDNVVQDFQLFTAGFGAQYSGATGAVFDVRLRDPRNINIETTLHASLLRAGIFLEGGVTENSAFYVSARQGLIQYFIPEDDEADEDGVRIISPPEDSDYQAKYVWDVNSDNSLSLLLAGAKDFAEAEFTDAAGFVQENPDFAGDALLEESFNSQGLTWNHQMASGGEFVLSLAKYEDNEKLELGDGYFIESVLDDEIFRGHIYIPMGDKHAVTLGAEYNDYNFDYSARMILFVCTEFDVTCQDGRRDVVEDERVLTLTDTTAYIIDHWQVSKTINIETGLQWNSNDYTEEDFINPRIAIEWWALDSMAITSSAGRYNRLPDIDTIMPLIGNPELSSPLADHFTMGLKGEVGLNWNWSVETYHKNLSNLPLALSGGDRAQRYSNDVEGTAQGVDLFLNRNLADKWYGWVSLSYSQSDRTNIRTGETRDYFLDTPLVLNVVGNYQFTEKWNAGFRLTAKSGQSTTEIINVKPNPNPDYPDNYLPVYGEPYAERLPAYIQLDLRAKRDIQWFGHDGSFYIDVLNALNRENVIATQLDYTKVNATGLLHTEDDVSMGIFPSIGMSVTF